MGPDGPREELADALTAIGCEARETAAGVICVDCPDHETKCRLLDVLAWRDARYDPRVRKVAARIAAGASSDGHRVDRLDLARRLHAFVCGRVRYLGEGADTFQTTWETLTLGVGDCDDGARALLALARSCALPARLVLFDAGDGSKLAPTHASVQLSPDGVRWFWAETSLGPGARFGEEPRAAARRLVSADRADLGDLEGVGGPVVACSILRNAWVQVLGREPSTFELLLSASVADAETGFGTWSGAMEGSHNWGAIQCSRGATQGENTPGFGCQPNQDTNQDGSKYTALFKTYPDDLEGAIDLVRQLTQRSPLTRAALARGRCVEDVSRAMYREHYYGSSCPKAIKQYGQAAARESYYGGHKLSTTAAGIACDEEAIRSHVNRVGSLAAQIAKATGKPAPRIWAPSSSPWLVVAGVAAVAGGAYYGYRKGWFDGLHL